MKCEIFLFLFAVILSAAAAPASDVNSEEAFLQVALDDEVDFGVNGVKEQDAAEAESMKTDDWINLIRSGIKLAGRLKSSKPRTKSAQTAAHFSSNNDPIPSDLMFSRDVIDQPHILPVEQPDSDAANQPDRIDPDSSAVRKSPCGSTHNPCTQRFLPSDVQERYNKMTGNHLIAETEAIGAILTGAWKAYKAYQAYKHLKNLIPKSGSNSGSNSGSPVNHGRNELPQTGTGEEMSEDREQLEEAEIEKFKTVRSILSKTLRVLNYKLKPRNRTPSQDRQAVDNPTGWKDLGRNVLGIVGDKLDPAQRRQGREGENTAQKQVTLEIQSVLEDALSMLGSISRQHTLNTETGTHEEVNEESHERMSYPG